MADEETLVQKQVRLVLEKQCREIAEMLKKAVPAGVGFFLFLSDLGKRGNVAYLSTIERESVFRLVHEWLDKENANHPEEGWEIAAAFLMACQKELGLPESADPETVLRAIRELKA